jgi:deoxyribonuclease I
MRKIILALFIIGLIMSGTPSLQAAEYPASWSSAKNTAQDEVYEGGKTTTFYCGCPYRSDNDDDGSGKVDLADCGMQALPKKRSTAKVIQWEHIVPASLMPAHEHPCWNESEKFPQCVSSSGKVTGKRDCCVRVKTEFKNMIFDLHNLAPSIGQVNQYRSNGRYGIAERGEQWLGCEAKDLGSVSHGPQNLFEPPDCMKGNVARVWLYMSDVHGVVIFEKERAMFNEWDQADPVNAWEKIRDMRIKNVQGTSNPYVADRPASEAGNCSWD